ncbi:polyisoprenoid-binding protein [Phyllobacterium salinisoli]|uniref:Polyisoprenoid-binding protein n=1 Tax=Phyllobacterium salinisoli TaxID=1899321 RepID=A0A368K3R1_9HYPH|nr:YceI family protein [Phyllobacterium salinisoli]RCS23022.1 polyisoprenoid-binding protein [Phyllobacterium salinisoli]
MFRTAVFCAMLGVFWSPGSLAANSLAPAGTYKTDPSHSSLHWSFSHYGLSSFTARFTKVDARLVWNPEKPERSALTVKIDPLSVRTDYPWPEQVDFDGKIGGHEMFLAGKPITFRSRKIIVTGEKTGTVEGLLTFRGKSHPASLDVVFNGSMADHPMMRVAKLGFSATGTIRRSMWGLDFAIPELGDEVKLVIETQMVPADFVFE